MRKLLLAGLGLAALGLLAACDNGPSAVAARDHSAPAPAPAPAADAASRGVDASATVRDDPRDQPVPRVDGKPMWSANSRFTAQENAQRAFERNGAAFGAASVDAFVGKAHAFVDHPPAGAETVTRANGDRMIYDPGSNVFAVVSKAGAPRTMFKPDDGPAYWAAQKAREAKRDDDRG